jgi:aminoglycoside phosphotransferase family enzyme/predicted kinase
MAESRREWACRVHAGRSRSHQGTRLGEISAPDGENSARTSLVSGRTGCRAARYWRDRGVAPGAAGMRRALSAGVMTCETQQTVIEFLASPGAHEGSTVERIDTHSAIVFLSGDRALKLKRAVRFDYLDFSTPALRRVACEAEVRLNRRTAPAIYRGVVAVTQKANGALALNGRGVPVDWCVDMTRFDQDALLDRLAGRGALTLGMTESLAAEVARFHLAADVRPDHGGSASMRWVIDGNAQGFAEYGRDCLDQEVCRRLTDRLRRELEQRAALLDQRQASGLVRQCHGDLHLRNIVLLDGQPTPFDGVEFNDEIACIDVFYDLAFLLMDLWQRGLKRQANVLLNGYLARTLDVDGLATLPLFLACRAAILAKTSATAAGVQTADRARRELEALARRYLSIAVDLSQPARPVLAAIGGRSGTGKSTLAQALAADVGPAPGAVVLRSDLVRKALHGVSPLERLPASAYAPEMSRRVYRTLADRARDVLRGGHAAIVDAVFATPAERAALEAVAAGASTPFVGIWLDAPPVVLIERVEHRQLDASDADAAVVRQQSSIDPGRVDWQRLDAARPEDVVLADARAQLGRTERKADAESGRWMAASR